MVNAVRGCNGEILISKVLSKKRRKAQLTRVRAVGVRPGQCLRGVEGPSCRGAARDGEGLVGTDAVLHAAEAGLLAQADRVSAKCENKV